MRLMNKFIITFLVIISLSTTIFIALLHSSYANTAINQVIGLFSPYQIYAKKINYDIRDPLHLDLQRVEIAHNNQIILHANSIMLWLSKQTISNQMITFDGVKIDNVELNSTGSLTQLPPLKITRLLLDNTNITTSAFSLKKGSIAIDNWQTPTQQIPWWQSFQGNVQLNAKTIKWQNLTLENVLINGDKKANQLQLNGFSGFWQKTAIDGQATIDDKEKNITFKQLTVNHLRLQNVDIINQLQNYFNNVIAPTTKITIKRLDIMDSSIELPQWSANDINLSLENWHWPQTVWQQENSQLSFSASDAKWHNTVFTQPLAQLQFMPNQIISHGLSAKMLEGFVRVDGWLSPQQLYVSQLKANGIKWFLPKNWLDTWQIWQKYYQDIIIHDLDISNSQVTSTISDLPFQLTGIDIEAKDAMIKQNNQWGLWQGNIETSLGFGSIKQITMTDAIAQMHSNAGQWQLDTLILPFKDGMLKARGRIALSDPLRPWKVTLLGDSIPANILYRWLKLPLPLNGAIDSQIKLSGNAINQQTLNESLTGKALFNFRQLHLDNVTPKQLFHLWQQPQMTTADLFAYQTVNKQQMTLPSPLLQAAPLTITADKGHIHIQPWQLTTPDFSLKLDSNWDLTVRQQQQFNLAVRYQCQLFHKQWDQGRSLRWLSSSCIGNTKYVPVKLDATSLPQ